MSSPFFHRFEAVRNRRIKMRPETVDIVADKIVEHAAEQLDAGQKTMKVWPNHYVVNQTKMTKLRMIEDFEMVVESILTKSDGRVQCKIFDAESGDAGLKCDLREPTDLLGKRLHPMGDYRSVPEN